MNNFISVKTDKYDHLLINLAHVLQIEPVMDGDGGCLVYFNTAGKPLLINDDFDDMLKKLGVVITSAI